MWGLTNIRLTSWPLTMEFVRRRPDLDRKHLSSLNQTISLEEVIPTADRILAGAVRGRIVVRL